MKAFALACLTAWVAGCGDSKPLRTDGGSNTRRDGSAETVVDAGRDHGSCFRRAGGSRVRGGRRGRGRRKRRNARRNVTGRQQRSSRWQRRLGRRRPSGKRGRRERRRRARPNHPAMQPPPTDGRPSNGCVSAGLFDTGTSPLVNAFVTPDGIIVVRANSIALLGRDRSVKQMVTTLAPISTAELRRSDAGDRRHRLPERVHQRAGSAGDSSVAGCLFRFLHRPRRRVRLSEQPTGRADVHDLRRAGPPVLEGDQRQFHLGRPGHGAGARDPLFRTSTSKLTIDLCAVRRGSRWNRAGAGRRAGR